MLPKKRLFEELNQDMPETPVSSDTFVTLVSSAIHLEVSFGIVDIGSLEQKIFDNNLDCVKDVFMVLCSFLSNFLEIRF